MARDIAANLRLHWGLAFLILACDIGLTITTVLVKNGTTDPVPQGGDTDRSAAIGWVSVLAGLFCFGTYGICMKTPSVEDAGADVMVWQCYYSYSCALVSLVIWLCTGAFDGLTMTPSSLAYGCLFGVLWIASQICAFRGIQILGYAVGPAIWIGVSIIVSFLWGSMVFHNDVSSAWGAVAALMTLLLGVGAAAYASSLSGSPSEAEKPMVEGEQTQNHGSPFVGFLFALGVGLTNGSTMVPMTCFHQGCLGSEPFDKADQIPAMAFLPSLAAGIAIAQPILFLLYWAPSLLRGDFPKFHPRAIAGPSFYTGLTWGMGNFNTMFGTVYLGQTIGFPLSQCCLVLNGLVGILYFQELTGSKPIALFCLGSLIIFGGAALLSLYG